MSHGTKIQWTWIPGYKGESWNPASGCSPVSAGCAHCYARRMALRFPKVYPKGFDVHLRPERLDIPLRWTKPRAIFCASMGDIFHDEIPDEYILKVFEVMACSQDHLFLLLTKRPERMREWMVWYKSLDFSPHDHHAEAMVTIGKLPLPNVLLGVTAENQETADERIPILLDTPAALRFVSVEPMLGPVDIREFIGYGSYRGSVPGQCVNIDGETWHRQDEKCRTCGWGYPNDPEWPNRVPGISWTICGGESGPKARPMNQEWALDLLRQCQDANVPYFYKQNGAWCPEAGVDEKLLEAGGYHYDDEMFDEPYVRLGRKAGIPLILNTREFPEVPR